MNSIHKPVRPATNLSLLPSNLYSFFLFLLFFNFFVKHSFKQRQLISDSFFSRKFFFSENENKKQKDSSFKLVKACPHNRYSQKNHNNELHTKHSLILILTVTI